MIERMILTVMAVVLTGLGITACTSPTESKPVSLVTVTPSPTTMALPACEYEDGSGQMLCAWDASESGNGVGTDVIAGDCSYDTVGSIEAMQECIKLYPRAAYWYMDGTARVDVSNGKALVEECETIAFDASQDKDMQLELQNEGWNLTECFKAFITNG